MRGRNFVGFGLALLAPIALAQAQHQSYPETRRVCYIPDKIKIASFG